MFAKILNTVLPKKRRDNVRSAQGKSSAGPFDLRDCFLKTFWDTDRTDLPVLHTQTGCTEHHGKTPEKAALFRVFREIRVQKRKQQGLKKHSLKEEAAAHEQ